MTPRPWLAITSILALLAGIGLGLLLVPNLRTRAHIDDVASTSFDERRRAWDWLQSSPGPFPLEQVNLARCLMRHLRPCCTSPVNSSRMHSWDWNSQSNDVMARYMSLLLWRSHIMDTEDVIILIGQSPIDMPDDTMLELGTTLFNHPDATVARRGFDALVSWCGYRPILLRMLDTLPPSRMDWSTHYLHLHERGRTPLKIGSESGVAPTTPGNMAAWPSSRTEAEHLLFDSVRIARNAEPTNNARLRLNTGCRIARLRPSRMWSSAPNPDRGGAWPAHCSQPMSNWIPGRSSMPW